MSGRSVCVQSHHSYPLRRRVCSEKGAEFFLETSLRNCDRFRKKVFSIARNIDDFIVNNNFKDADNLIQTLVEAHDNFMHSHLRYEELLGEQRPMEERQAGTAKAEEVSTCMKNCLQRFHELASTLNNPDIHLENQDEVASMYNVNQVNTMQQQQS